MIYPNIAEYEENDSQLAKFTITGLHEEIRRLRKCYCERTDCAGRIKNSKKFDSIQQENERLNNIINELEKHFRDEGLWYSLQKLQELKDSDINE